MNGQSRIVMAATVTAVCGLLNLAAIAQPQGLDAYQVLNRLGFYSPPLAA